MFPPDGFVKSLHVLSNEAHNRRVLDLPPLMRKFGERTAAENVSRPQVSGAHRRLQNRSLKVQWGPWMYEASVALVEVNLHSRSREFPPRTPWSWREDVGLS